MEETQTNQTQTQALFWIMGAVVGGLVLLAVLGYVFFGAELRAHLSQAAARSAYAAGQSLEAEGKPEAALQRYRQALEEHTMDEALRRKCLLAMGDLLVGQRRFDEALDAYDRLSPEVFVEAPESFVLYLQALDYEQDAERGVAVAVLCIVAAPEEEDADIVTDAFRIFVAAQEEQDYDAVMAAWGMEHISSPEEMAALARLRDAVARIQ